MCDSPQSTKYQLISKKRRRLSSSDEQLRDLPKTKPTSSDLCERCNAIEWSLLAKKSKNNLPVDYFNEAITKTHKELRSSPCEVCQLLSLLKSSDLESLSCALNAIGLYKFFTGPKTRRSRSQPETSIISVVSEGSKPLVDRRQLGHVIAVEPSSQESSVVQRERFEYDEINFGLIANWMATCSKYHPECKPGIRSSGHTLRVIDCKRSGYINQKEPELVDLPADGIYAALSYVWGAVNHKFPQVVRDSITVALQLNCEYLWVDRHCILQENDNTKKQQEIERMDEIYSQAFFTIVDATGTDSNYGLAGFAHPRKPHRYARVPGAKLIYLGTPPAEKIGSSPWGSRGWTYQEGFLSHRRIFFTDEQVMFQCNVMTCLESFRIPMKPKDREEPYLKDTEPLRLSIKDFGGHLMEFSKRTLTKDGDTLKAFLGVLNHLRKEDQCFHLYGNPIPVKKERGHLINAWYHNKPGVRNAEFPSWSWTGWKGEIKTTSRNSPEYVLRVLRTRQPGGSPAGSPAEHPDGVPMSLDEYKKACRAGPPQDMVPVIELTGMMTMISFEVIKWKSEAVCLNEGVDKASMRDGAWAILPWTNDITYRSFLYLDNEALTGICQFKLPVMVLQSGKEKPDQNIVILVLREKGHRFERVGMVILWRGDNGSKANLTMYRDKSGTWKEPSAIRKLQEFTLWGKLRDQRIRLQ